MKLLLAVFDMVGTTVQSGNEVPGSFRRAFSRVGIALSDEAIAGIRGRAKHEAIRELLVAHGVPADGVPEMSRIVLEHFQDTLRAAYKSTAMPIPGAEGVFEFLKGLGIRIVLTTGLDRGTANVLLQGLGWDSLGITGSISGDDVKRGRPAPDLILAAMRLAAVADSQAVLAVGDTAADLEAAAAAGVGWTVGVLTGAHSRAHLEARPHSVILDSVAELPRWLTVTGAIQPD